MLKTFKGLKLIKIFNILIAALVMATCLGFSYGPMNGFPIIYLETQVGQITFKDRDYLYRMNIYSGQHDLLPEWGQKLNMAGASLFILNEADKLSLPLDECFPLVEYDMLLLKKAELEQRMIGYGLYPKDSSLLGMFDAMRVQPENAKIFVASDLGEKIGRQTYIHELTHYWHYRLCWERISSEDLAQYIERVYMERK